mgnify:CR=1 FL=1
MNLSSAFPCCTVRALTEADMPEMYALCAGNPLYYEHFGSPLTWESLHSDLTALPPGTTPEQKYFVGLRRNGKLIALLDLICDYPAPGTAYIGWFILAAEVQGQGIGSRLIKQLCDMLSASGIKKIRLAYVLGNPQSKRFWEKNGFRPTGEEKDMGSYRAVCMELTL